MILKLKQPLSRYYLLLVVSLLFPLAGFFVYATRFEAHFSLFISGALLVNVVILAVLHHRLKQKRALVKLQKEEFFEKSNLLKGDLVKEEEVISASRQKIVSYSQLKEVVEKLSANLSTDDTIHTICYEVTGLFAKRESAVLLYLVDPNSGELSIVHSSRNHHPVAVKQKRGDVFDRWILKALQPLIVENVANDFRFDAEQIADKEGRAIGSVMSAPLIVDNKLIGILRLDSPVPDSFTPDDLRFLKTVADIGAVALENAQLYDKVEDLAIRDGLTGLYLRRYFMERMGEEINRGLRKGKDLCFVMFDLDHFKQYNDRFGHTAGDIVLKCFAGLLEKHFHAPGHLICRYGGEEFCVALPEYDKEGAAELVQEFIEIVAQEEIVLRREKTQITVSAGLASLAVDAKTREDLIQKADEALYQAKHNGRNRLCVA